MGHRVSVRRINLSGASSVLSTCIFLFSSSSLFAKGGRGVSPKGGRDRRGSRLGVRIRMWDRAEDVVKRTRGCGEA